MQGLCCPTSIPSTNSLNCQTPDSRVMQCLCCHYQYSINKFSRLSDTRFSCNAVSLLSLPVFHQQILSTVRHPNSRVMQCLCCPTSIPSTNSLNCQTPDSRVMQCLCCHYQYSINKFSQLSDTQFSCNAVSLLSYQYSINKFSQLSDTQFSCNAVSLLSYQYSINKFSQLSDTQFSCNAVSLLSYQYSINKFSQLSDTPIRFTLVHRHLFSLC